MRYIFLHTLTWWQLYVGEYSETSLANSLLFTSAALISAKRISYRKENSRLKTTLQCKCVKFYSFPSVCVCCYCQTLPMSTDWGSVLDDLFLIKCFLIPVQPSSQKAHPVFLSERWDKDFLRVKRNVSSEPPVWSASVIADWLNSYKSPSHSQICIGYWSSLSAKCIDFPSKTK